MKANKSKFVLLLILLIVGSLAYLKIYYPNYNLKYSQEYIIGQNNIKGEVDTQYFSSKGKEFEIGANKYGYAVFKNPIKALKKLKTDYRDGLRVIQKEFNLFPINKLNYKSYGIYGWQVTTGSKEEKEQSNFISSFIDIYENSFSQQ